MPELVRPESTVSNLRSANVYSLAAQVGMNPKTTAYVQFRLLCIATNSGIETTLLVIRVGLDLLPSGLLRPQ
jgi:hypothetical protein